jgi:D-inositol-3-phosphate glycosyltransferase
MPWRHAEYLIRVFVALIKGALPDVLNFHGQPEGLLLAKALRRPAVLFYDYYFFRGGRRTAWAGVYRRLLMSFDLLLPCSQYCLEQSLSYWHLEGKNARVQFNGVNLAQFEPDPQVGAIERAHLGPTGLIILYVGRVNSQKGTDLLLDSFAALRKTVDGVSLLVAGPIAQFGSDHHTQEIQRWTSAIENAGGMYLGAVEEERLAALYNAADVFVMPTRELEMFGMAAVEAQACGVPVVASDHGGLRETVPNDCGGRFPPGDAVALTAELQRLLEDVDLRQRCAAAATANAARFSWERVVADLERHYSQADIHG